MPKVTYDSDVFMRRKPRKLPGGFYMSAVVLEELVAGAQDGAELDELEAAMRNYEKGDRLLVPTGEDWYQAGKVIYAMQQGKRSRKTGDIPPMPSDMRARIVNDVLIARTAKRAGVAVVTYNVRHFEAIQHYCAVRVIKAAEYFSV
jgi:predicted nucleic acid-binding protein